MKEEFSKMIEKYQKLNVKTPGYQYLAIVLPKETFESKGGIIMADKTMHNVAIGLVFAVGNMASNETPDICEGTLIWFHENDMKTLVVDNLPFAVINSNVVKCYRNA